MKKIPYGGDYNPEQWEEVVWDEDYRLFQLAGIDILTVNVFSWALLQRDEDTYDFTMLDKTVEKASKQGMSLCMATSTAAHPAWMARKYPDILRTEANGIKRKFGGRHNSCPNSPTYQKYAVRLTRRIAERYKENKNIIAWHIGNEFSGRCYCENCEIAFRLWLRDKYKTLENLNQEWCTAFWGHTFYEWEDIVIPDYRSEEFGNERTVFQGISIDYARFCSDSLLKNYVDEYKAIKELIPDAKITTNLMGLYKYLDYQKWAEYMDFVSYDNYPGNGESPSYIAMRHDLMRGLKQGKPFWLMEQTPSVSNWLPNNSLKRPGIMRLWSYQAVAHGADSVMFFQMRRSRGACEKYHGAVIDHVGNEQTRVFREVAQLGKELEMIGDATIGSRIVAKAAIIFDWDNWWAVEYSAGPSNKLKYTEEIYLYYQAFHNLNIAIDFISCKDDFSNYQLIVAPLLYMVKPEVADKIKLFTKNGGSFMTTYFSGYVNENDRVTIGGYPGEIRDLLGIWVEEIDSLADETENSFYFEEVKYPARLLCDLIHLEGAHALSKYQEDFYKGMPVVTKNKFGQGNAYYIATRSNEDFYESLVKSVCKELKIEASLKSENGVEATIREKDDKKYLFVLNHGMNESKISVPVKCRDLISEIEIDLASNLTLEPYGVMILEILKQGREIYE